MQIDPKILEEVAKAIYLTADGPRNPIYNPAEHIENPIEMARAAIETYERLKPSPWRPIEEADGNVCRVKTKEGYEYYSVLMAPANSTNLPQGGWVVCDHKGVAFFGFDGKWIQIHPIKFLSILK